MHLKLKQMVLEPWCTGYIDLENIIFDSLQVPSFATAMVIATIQKALVIWWDHEPIQPVMPNNTVL